MIIQFVQTQWRPTTRADHNENNIVGGLRSWLRCARVFCAAVSGGGERLIEAVLDVVQVEVSESGICANNPALHFPSHSPNRTTGPGFCAHHRRRRHHHRLLLLLLLILPASSTPTLTRLWPACPPATDIANSEPMEQCTSIITLCAVLCVFVTHAHSQSVSQGIAK